MFTAKSKSLKSGPFAIENNSISKHRGYEGSLRLVKNNKIIRNKMISFAHSI